jgi:diguanylate cyclase (GGDEF)-like protein
MDELKNYGEKTTEINIEIQKRVLVLSSLLQVSSLISQGAKLDDIFKLTAEKARLLANSELSYLLFRNDNQETFYMKAVDGMNVGHLLKITVDPDEKIFARLVDSNRPAILDKENVFPEKYVAEFYDKFKIKNNLALPVYLKGRVIAILGIGNSRQQFLYGKDDVELLDIFAKQISIAVENDLLLHKVEKLEIKDTLTGLYNDGFIRTRLQEEIKRAVVYQRPCAFILFDIDNFEKFHQNCGSLVAESSLKKIAVLIKDSVSEIDKVGRVGDDEFAIILPEKNKRQAQEIADDIRKKVEFAFSEDPDSKKHLTVSAGVSENPLDGIDSQELLSKAQGYVKLAKDKGKNRVVVIN